MENSLIQSDVALADLARKISRGECILFLGSAVHAPPPEGSPYAGAYSNGSGPLLGGDLSEKLADECGYRARFPNESARDLQRVALCLETTKGLDRCKLIECLEEFLMKDKKPSPVLKMLAALPFRIIVTTNYDRLMEFALRSYDKDPAVVIYDPDDNKPTPDSPDPTEQRPLVFKMHGDLQNKDSIVITDEDYITFVMRMSDKEALHPVPETVRYRLKTWCTLFVGYSLKDYNLRLLFKTLRWRLQKSQFPPSFSVDLFPDPLILQVWQDEKKLVTFVPQDVWAFVPWLYGLVKGEQFHV